MLLAAAVKNFPPFFTEFGFSIYRENDECNDPLDNFVN
jgi:hypothetical protein